MCCLGALKIALPIDEQRVWSGLLKSGLASGLERSSNIPHFPRLCDQQKLRVQRQTADDTSRPQGKATLDRTGERQLRKAQDCAL